MKITTKQITITAMFIALSVALSFVKINGSIALDALPAFAGAALLGPIFGGVIAVLGHFATAATSGFNLGYDTHFVIAISMFIAAFGFGLIIKAKYLYTDVIAIIFAIAMNMLPLLYVGIRIDFGLAWALTPSLLLAATVNVLLGYVVGRRLLPIFKYKISGTR